MDILLISFGIVFVIIGFYVNRKNNEFDVIYDEVVKHSDDILNALKPSTDIISKSDEIIDRLNALDSRLNYLEEKKESEYQKVLDDIDIKNKSVSEIAKLTGMNKGEILLLKRFSQD